MSGRTIRASILAIACFWPTGSAWFVAAEFSVEPRWDVRFVPTSQEPLLPERFRLTAHEFSWREQPRPKVSDRLSISDVTFPSPVVTEYPENNTVHCEYYRPNVLGKRPASSCCTFSVGIFR